MEKALLTKPGMFLDKEQSKAFGDGLTFPLNVFYKFEIERFQNIVEIMRNTLNDIRSAIKGEIIMTQSLSDSINSLYNARVPQTWLFNAANEEISWMSSNIDLW